MSDLTNAQWREIEKAGDGYARVCAKEGIFLNFRVVPIPELRAIIKKSRRTNDQNALAWVLYQQILDRGGEAMRGWSTQDLHDFFLIQHFGADTIEAFGMRRLKPKRRSSRLTKSEFSDYLETIVRFMAEQGVQLSLPDEQAA